MPEPAYYEVDIKVTFTPKDRYNYAAGSNSYIELRRKIKVNDLAETIAAVDQIGSRADS